MITLIELPNGGWINPSYVLYLEPLQSDVVALMVDGSKQSIVSIDEEIAPLIEWVKYAAAIVNRQERTRPGKKPEPGPSPQRYSRSR